MAQNEQFRHPNLGLPPSDFTRGRPEAADLLRRERGRLGRVALEAAVRIDPTLQQRYDEVALRHFLRDYEQHLEQLAKALASAEDTWVTNYAEWLVPVYRRREVPMKDFGVLLLGLRDAVVSALSPEDGKLAEHYLQRFRTRLKRHQALPGDHKGNSIVRFFWKGAGVLDEDVI